MTQKITTGRIVNYFLPEGPNIGQERPAIVVRVTDPENQIAKLRVFIDHEVDHGSNKKISRHPTARLAPDDEPRKPGCWNWPVIGK